MAALHFFAYRSRIYLYNPQSAKRPTAEQPGLWAAPAVLFSSGTGTAENLPSIIPYSALFYYESLRLSQHGWPCGPLSGRLSMM